MRKNWIFALICTTSETIPKLNVEDSLWSFDLNKNYDIKMALTPFCFAFFKVLGLWGGLNIGPWVAKIERLTHVFDRLVCRDIDMLRSLKTKKPFFHQLFPWEISKVIKSWPRLQIKYTAKWNLLTLPENKNEADLPEPII